MTEQDITEQGITVQENSVQGEAAHGDTETWFAGKSRVLFVHAHPDDETISTGGTLAALAEAGREPLLITLTRGEMGEVVAGPLQGMVQVHGLAVVRQNELRTALGMLGVERHAFLGVDPARAEDLEPIIYEDSGMQWSADGVAVPAAEVSNDALTSVPAVEALNDLLAGAYLSGAQAIVSYNDQGGYGHPDHVLAHRLARAVAMSLEIPFFQIVPEFEAADEVESEIGVAITGIEETFEIHDVSPWLERKQAALRAYPTQLTVSIDGTEIEHVGGQKEAVSMREVFQQL